MVRYLCWHWASLQSRPTTSTIRSQLSFFQINACTSVPWWLELTWSCERQWHQGHCNSAWHPRSGAAACKWMGQHYMNALSLGQSFLSRKVLCLLSPLSLWFYLVCRCCVVALTHWRLSLIVVSYCVIDSLDETCVALYNINRARSLVALTLVASWICLC